MMFRSVKEREYSRGILAPSTFQSLLKRLLRSPRSDLVERWTSRLVATAEENRG